MTIDPPEHPECVEALGDELWNLLGASEVPPISEGFDERVRSSWTAVENKDVLGDELWEVLGGAEEPALPQSLETERPSDWAEAEGKAVLGDEIWSALGDGGGEKPVFPDDIDASLGEVGIRMGAPLTDVMEDDVSLPQGFAGSEKVAGLAQVRDAFGDKLWATMGAWETPVPSVRFDDLFREKLRAPHGEVVPLFRRRAVQVAVFASAMAAAAAALLFVENRTVLIEARPGDDLAMLADLELMEQLDLVSHPDFELLLEWNGRAP